MGTEEVQRCGPDLNHLITAKEGAVMPIQGKVVAAIEHLARLIDHPVPDDFESGGIGEQCESVAGP
jgi:hypothetical protein